MTPETAYNEATLKNMADPNGTRMDVIYTAMHIFRNELIDEEIGFLYSIYPHIATDTVRARVQARIEYLKKLKG